MSATPSFFSRCLNAINPFRIDAPDERRNASRLNGHDLACSLGEIQDISATGVRVRCRRLYRPYEGNSVTLQLSPSDATDRLTIKGTVCWTTVDDGQWYAGIAFGALSEENARTLGAMLHDRAQTTADARRAA